MGFNNTLIAIKSHDENQLLKELKLEKKKTNQKPKYFYASHSENEIVGGVFNSDWYLIMDGTWTIYENPDISENCSQEFEILVCGIGEGWMGSSLSCWKEGKNIWHVEYSFDNGPTRIEERGDLPAIYKDIKVRNISRESYFEVATDLFAELAGFDYGNLYSNDNGTYKYLKLAFKSPLNRL